MRIANAPGLNMNKRPGGKQKREEKKKAALVLEVIRTNSAAINY